MSTKDELATVLAAAVFSPAVIAAGTVAGAASWLGDQLDGAKRARLDDIQERVDRERQEREAVRSRVREAWFVEHDALETRHDMGQLDDVSYEAALDALFDRWA